jgi:hypothetical protein
MQAAAHLAQPPAAEGLQRERNCRGCDGAYQDLLNRYVSIVG